MLIRLLIVYFNVFDVTCCLRTEDFVGAGPRLMLPLPVEALIKCVSCVSFVCWYSFKELIPLFLLSLKLLLLDNDVDEGGELLPFLLTLKRSNTVGV